MQKIKKKLKSYTKKKYSEHETPEQSSKLKRQLRKQEKVKEYYDCIWSSAKILEFTIRSIISRQQHTGGTMMISQTTGKTSAQIEESIRDVIEPFNL